MADLVQLLNENGYLADGQAYESVWISQGLNRKDLGKVYTLPHVELLYTAEADTTIEVSGSGDGGTTWPVIQVVPLQATREEPDHVRRVATALRVTGADLRLRVRFDQTIVSNIHVYIPPLIERGRAHNAVR